jgi:formylglycine-generating enzyme
VSGLRRLAVALGGVAATLPLACRDEPTEGAQVGGAAAARPGAQPADPAPESAPPRELYLPDGGDLVQNQGQLEVTAPLLPYQPPLPGSRCPPEMVSVNGRFCIDRFEASLVDERERALSPYFPPSRDELLNVLSVFGNLRPRARSAPPLPLPPDYSRDEPFEPRARSAPGVVPSGYMSGVMARRACDNAGKRLCSAAEWTTACKGERATKFPYGDRYAKGECNVFREAHPAAVLYGDASKNHLDPRLNLTEGPEGPLLRKTGATTGCRSEWGPDAIYDMVGNLDEWVDDPAGAFHGGFYARGTREGCDARIASHPPRYLDYSLGVRCCR